LSGFLNMQLNEYKEDEHNEEISYLREFNKINFNAKYKFNIDNNLSAINRNNFAINGTYKKIFGNLIFDEKNNHVGSERTLTLNAKKLFAQNYFLNFETKKNLKTNSSEYNNLSFNYQNDCILASIIYSKNFYSDKDLKSSRSLILSISIKPFSDSIAPDLTSFIN